MQKNTANLLILLIFYPIYATTTILRRVSVNSLF
ncbi:MAG: hypothetical protein [Caudovirales sp. ctOwN3]|nr:MAG: hypothetical protein [Caudovirales sp. ctOwN3]